MTAVLYSALIAFILGLIVGAYAGYKYDQIKLF